VRLLEPPQPLERLAVWAAIAGYGERAEEQAGRHRGSVGSRGRV
jgi:hypothetical protein